MGLFSWWINSGILSNALLLALAINTGVIVVSILKDGYCRVIEPHRWIAWVELVMMAGIMALAIFKLF